PSEVNRLVILGSILNRLAAPLVIEAIGDFLDPMSPLATVEIIPYTGQQSNDRVDLYLLGTRANEDLEFWHFFKMAGSSNMPVLFHLQHDLDIDIAGLNGGKLELHYVVTNAEGDRESFHALLSVGEATATLPPPNVPEAPDGVLDPESSIRGATVVVPRAANLEEGDLLSVYWQGSKPGGSFRYRQFEVTRVWLDSDIPFPIERAYVDANKDGSVKAFYIVERGREPVRYSHTYHVRVGANLALRPPEVLETTEPGGNLLNPITAQNAVTIRVRYDEMKNSDNIQPYWRGVAGIGSPLIESRPGNAAQGYVDFTLSGDTAVGPNVGKMVEVSYEVTHGGATQPSDPLNLNIQAFNEGDLPAPDIVEATGSSPDRILDMNIFAGDATATVARWPLIAAGQRVWLECTGTDQEGLQYTISVLKAHPLSPSEATNGLVQALPRGELLKLRQDTQFKVLLRVAYDRTEDESHAVSFPESVFILKAFTIDVTDFSDGDWNGWTKGPAASDPRDMVLRGGPPPDTYYLHNYTYTHNSAGVVLQKTFHTLTIGKRYRFTMECRRHLPISGAVPSIIPTATNADSSSPGVELSETTWTTRTALIIPRSVPVELQVVSNVATGTGNDYDINMLTLEDWT
ncbi:hypothetical protein ACW9IU_30510, partial [Pseudomonas gingeri]